MSYERLFTAAAPISPEEHLPDAEIYASPLSRYVLDELPQDLSAIRANQLSYTDLAAKHAALLAEAEPSMLQNEDPHTAKITQLDLVFMLGSYIPTGSVFEAAPADLLLKLRQQSAYFGLPPLMTYDLVVNANSAEYLRTGQMRTFTTGETGRHERDFYLGHYQAEPFARSATEKLKQIIENTDNPGQYKLLQEGAQDVATLRRYMDAYLRFNPDDFAVIRPYLAKYPNQKPNASGAFMPGPQLLELALSPPTGGHVTYLQESGPYFPRYDQS
ncbi:MAG TPA: hypothetical protein VFB59_04780, partial [Candidatus Saccharimonadales bacterium]|nr:hypothetical protein [Candidatus Saccharimonadales bacterium]